MSYQEAIDALREAVETAGQRTRQIHRNEWPQGWAAIDQLLREDRDRTGAPEDIVLDDVVDEEPLPEPMEVTLDEEGDVVSARVLTEGLVKKGEATDFVDEPEDEGRHEKADLGYQE